MPATGSIGFSPSGPADTIMSSSGYRSPSECLMQNAPSSWIMSIIFRSRGRRKDAKTAGLIIGP